VLAIGVAFTLRDLVQRRLGLHLTVLVLAILIAAGLSALLDPSLALASGVAVLMAEGLDLFVYNPLQRWHLIVAVVASNLVGLVVDSVIFLWLAFGSLAQLEGQIIGKAWTTLVALPLVAGLRAWDVRRGLATA
jgi:uncharacterized PurR-regulated membrane protein YhhQ (DUF165 family)